jgi:catechol 2,3-dioxygenase-like lactoylglutathione lyase family enzyme
MAALDHVTFRTFDLEGTRSFLEAVLELTVGFRPNFPFAGYWLYDGADPVVHLIPGPSRAVDANREGIDHAAFRCADYDGMRRRLDGLGFAYSTMELPELGERRLFLRTPTGILIELIFRAPTNPADASQRDPR